MDILSLTTFFGWCLVINTGLLLFTTLALYFMKEWASNLHSEMFGVDKTLVLSSYFSYLAHFKLLILVFNLTPYIAFKLI